MRARWVVGALTLLASVWAVAATTRRTERVVHIAAKRFEFVPATVELERGEPVILELSALDRVHGFQCPELALDASIVPGEPTRVRLVPDRAGTFSFHCSVFCGDGHEDMGGEIVVRP